MIEFILGIALGIVVTIAIYNWILARATQQAREQIQELIGSLEEHAENNIPARVEMHQGVFYVFNTRDNTFMAQGSTMAELKDKIEARWKEATVFVTEGEEHVLQALKNTRTSLETDRI